MFENKVTWRCGRENSPSGFPAQWTPRQDGTNLKDEPGVGIQNIQKGLKRVFVSPSRVTYKWLCQLEGVTDSGRKPSQWLESRSEHEKQNTNACREDTAAEEQGTLYWCGDAQLCGVRGWCRAACQEIRRESNTQGWAHSRGSWSSSRKVPCQLGWSCGPPPHRLS